MSVAKLPSQAQAEGGELHEVTIFNSTEVAVTEDTSRLPSFYRALAIAAGDEGEKTYKRIPPATIGLDGETTAVAVKLKVRYPVDTAEPIVQRAFADDGEWRRVSTDETTWGAWRPTLEATALSASGSVGEDQNQLTKNIEINNETPSVYLTESDRSDPTKRYVMQVSGGVVRVMRKMSSPAWHIMFTLEKGVGDDSHVDLPTVFDTYRIAGSNVVGARKSGWTTASGTADRTTFATYTAPDISATPTEAEVQALADHVQVLSRHLKALIDDLHATAGHGLIGA